MSFNSNKTLIQMTFCGKKPHRLIPVFTHFQFSLIPLNPSQLQTNLDFAAGDDLKIIVGKGKSCDPL